MLGGPGQLDRVHLSLNWRNASHKNQVMHLDLTTKLAIDGFAVITGRLPEIAGIDAFRGLGPVVQLPGLAEIQVLTPPPYRLRTSQYVQWEFWHRGFPAPYRSRALVSPSKIFRTSMRDWVKARVDYPC